MKRKVSLDFDSDMIWFGFVCVCGKTSRTKKKKAEMRSNEERERGVSTHAVTFFKFIKGKRKERQARLREKK